MRAIIAMIARESITDGRDGVGADGGEVHGLIEGVVEFAYDSAGE